MLGHARQSFPKKLMRKIKRKAFHEVGEAKSRRSSKEHGEVTVLIE